MNLNRVFRFIYFGFVGDDAGHRRASGTKLEPLAKLLKEYGIAIRHGVSLRNDEYHALMSVDLIYRFSNRPKIDDEHSNRWPVKYNFLRNVAMSRHTLNAWGIENIQFDFEQLNVFCGYFVTSGEHDETINRMTEFLEGKYTNDESEHHIKKSNDTEKSSNERAAIFIKDFVNLLSVELKEKSVSIYDELRLGERSLIESSHYIITAIALKLMSELSKKKQHNNFGVTFLNDDLFLFYFGVIKEELFYKRTVELINRLQAFVDMFVIGVCYNKNQQGARKKYILDVMHSALSECVGLQVEGVKVSVRQFVDKYNYSFFEYMSKNRFKMYSSRRWYNEIYHLAEKDKEYFGFVTTVMSFLPRKSNDVKRIVFLSRKALDKRVREKERGERIQLNVQVDSETVMMLEELEEELGRKKFEVVMAAVKMMYREYLRPSRSTGPDFGVKPDQINNILADEKQDSNSRKSVRPKKASAWNKKHSSSNNEIQDAPHPSTLLDSASENGVSTAPPEVQGGIALC